MRRVHRAIMGIQPPTLKARIADVEGILKREGIGGVVVYAFGSTLGYTTQNPGYLRYLCNWDGHNSFSVLILLPGRDPILLNTHIFTHALAQELMWFKDVRRVIPPNLGLEIVKILKEAGLSAGRMGFVGREETPVVVWEALKEGLSKIEWIDFSGFLDERRVIKDELQLSFHRRAAEICDILFETLAREIKSGKRGYQLIADIEHRGRHEGCEYSTAWLTVGPFPDWCRYFKEECFRVPQPGDQILSGLYIIYQGHWGHANRTAVIGQPKDEYRKAFDISLEMQEAALERLKPGQDLNEVDIAAERVFRKYFPDAEKRNIFRYRVGHSLGYSYADPIATRPFRQHLDHPPERPEYDSPPLEIKPGMLFTIHPNFFVPGWAAGQVGDMVEVTETGYQLLTSYPRELLVW